MDMASKNPYPHNERLSYEFSPSQWSHRYGPDESLEQHVKFLTGNSQQAKSCPSVKVEGDIPYGPGEKQKMDIYSGLNAEPGAPFFLYIHGGYWQQLSRELSGFMVRPLVEAGATVLTIGYDLCPQVDLPTIVSEVRSATQYVLNMAREKGARGVYLCGHSAGAHLVAMILSEQSLQHRDLIKGAVLVSGIYNIEPLCYTYVNDPIGMTKEVAEDNSPTKYTDDVIQLNHANRYDVIVVVGDHDPAAFIQQAQMYHEVLVKGGVESEYIVLADHDHFLAIEQLAQPQSTLTKKITKMMGLQ